MFALRGPNGDILPDDFFNSDKNKIIAGVCATSRHRTEAEQEYESARKNHVKPARQSTADAISFPDTYTYSTSFDFNMKLLKNIYEAEKIREVLNYMSENTKIINEHLISVTEKTELEEVTAETILKIAKGNEAAAEIIAQDITKEGMGLKAAAKYLYDFASANKAHQFYGMSTKKAEELILKFYCISGDVIDSAPPADEESTTKKAGAAINIMDLM